MTENTRPVPGASAPRDLSQGEQKRAAGGGSNPKRRRRRGRGKGRSGQGAGQQGQQGQGGAKQGQKQGSAKQGPKQGQRRRRGGKQTNRSSRNPRQQHHQHRKPQYEHQLDSSIETRDETSAGGLVVSGMAEAVGPGGEVDLSQIYAALIGRLDRRGRLLWSMPKGHVEDGEHQWRTAEREVWEETGIEGEAFDSLGTIDYWFVSDGVRIHKTVHHNLLRYVDGILNDEDPEVTEVTWVPMSEIIERLAYADERKLARIAVDRMPDLARKEAAAGRATPQ